MTSQEIILTLENGVRFIQLNRPKTKNAFNSNTYRTVTNTLNEDANNDDVIVTIITGAGEYYSSGFDIKDAMNSFSEGGISMSNEVKLMIKAFMTYPKLLIAVINGPAVGIGSTTAALCDIVYASDRATFTTPFLRLGLCAEGCSSFTFPAIMGRSKASEMLLLGKQMTAQEAYDFNFVSKVIPHEELNDFITDLKKLGSTLSVQGVKINKKLIVENLKNVLCESFDREVKQLEECFLSEDFSNAMIKFMTRKSKL